MEAVGAGGGRFTRLSLIMSGVLCVSYLVATVMPSSTYYITLVPGKVLPCVWILITAGYVELSLASVRGPPKPFRASRRGWRWGGITARVG